MEVNVDLTGGSEFVAEVRGHKVVVDLPEKKGGSDKGPTPIELFTVSLGACAGVFASRYLKTAGFDPSELRTSVRVEYDEKGSLIEKIFISVKAPNCILAERKRALFSAVEKCILHKTIINNPEIDIKIEGE